MTIRNGSSVKRKADGKAGIVSGVAATGKKPLFVMFPDEAGWYAVGELKEVKADEVNAIAL